MENNVHRYLARHLELYHFSDPFCRGREGPEEPLPCIATPGSPDSPRGPILYRTM